MRQALLLGLLGCLLFTPLEWSILLQERPPVKLNIMKKFTDSEEHFDIKIEIVSADTKIGFENRSGDFGISTADSEVPKDTNRFW